MDFGEGAKERFRRLTWGEYVQRRAEVATSAVGGTTSELRRIYGGKLATAEYVDLAHYTLGPADAWEKAKLAFKLAYGAPVVAPRARQVHASPIDAAADKRTAELAGALWVRHMVQTAARLLEGQYTPQWCTAWAGRYRLQSLRWTGRPPCRGSWTA